MSSGEAPRIAVIGYGSLLSEKSARETIPSLEDFRIVRVPGYKRVFNKVGIVFFERYGGAEFGKRIASCSTRASPDHSMLCSRFLCSESDFLLMYEREHRFAWASVHNIDVEGRALEPARMCTENTDENYILNKCITLTEYHRRVGRFYKGRIWRDDILPFPTYLVHCLKAAESQGKEVLDNFLDSSFLADGETNLRTYVSNDPDWSAGAQASYSYDD